MKYFILISLFLSLHVLADDGADSWKPIENTCAKHGEEVAAEYLKKSSSDLEKMTDQDALQYVSSRLGYELYNSFIFFNSPSLFLSEKVVRLNYLKMLKLYCNITPTDNSLINLLKETKACSTEYFSKLTVKNFSYTDHQDQLTGPDLKNMKTLTQVLQLLKEKTKLPIDGLFNNIAGTLAVLSPSTQSPYIVLPHEILKLSVNPTLTDLSKKLHFYLLDLMLNTTLTGKVKGKDIFDDLRLFFIAEGYKDKAARALSFYYLGIFSTRGASMYSSLYFLYPTSFAALETLSMAISYLDKVAMKEGRNYIIPSQYRAKCHLGKPYHFWLSAFEAYYEQQQGHSAAAGYFLPVIGGIGYDFTMTANGRDIKKLFQIKSPYDSYANMTRIDNWARSMGAHFGKHKGVILPLNGDELLEETFAKGQMPSKIPTEMADMISEYLRIVQPIPMILKLSL
ncbi:MAG: hypothetical protein ACOYL6_14595 [Bacteriovoracaceae bacterium]